MCASLSLNEFVEFARAARKDQALFRPSEIATYLKLAVMCRCYVPGARIGEAEVAEAFGISRTPAREALRQLAAVGILQIRPNRGAIVRVYGDRELLDINVVRCALEGHAVEMFCREEGHKQAVEPLCNQLTAIDLLDSDTPAYRISFLNYQFHRDLIGLYKSEIVRELFESFSSRLMVAWAYAPIHLASLKEVNAEHWAILRAIIRGDGEAAAAAVRRHVEGYQARLLSALHLDEHNGRVLKEPDFIAEAFSSLAAAAGATGTPGGDQTSLRERRGRNCEERC